MGCQSSGFLHTSQEGGPKFRIGFCNSIWLLSTKRFTSTIQAIRNEMQTLKEFYFRGSNACSHYVTNVTSDATFIFSQLFRHTIHTPGRVRLFHLSRTSVYAPPDLSSPHSDQWGVKQSGKRRLKKLGRPLHRNLRPMKIQLQPRIQRLPTHPFVIPRLRRSL